jgi:hypothetical protein
VGEGVGEGGSEGVGKSVGDCDCVYACACL